MAAARGRGADDGSGARRRGGPTALLACVSGADRSTLLDSFAGADEYAVEGHRDLKGATAHAVAAEVLQHRVVAGDDSPAPIERYTCQHCGFKSIRSVVGTPPHCDLDNLARCR